MSARRKNNRDASENNEERIIWKEIQRELKGIPGLVNENTDQMKAIVAQDRALAQADSDKESGGANSAEFSAVQSKLDDMLRAGVKNSEMTKTKLSDLITRLQTLIALRVATERDTLQSQGGLPSGQRSAKREGGRIASTREKAHRSDSVAVGEKESDKERTKGKDKEKEPDRDPYDFIGPEDSPAPSPMGSHTKKLGSGSGSGGSGSGAAGTGSDRSGNRDSVPPRAGTGERETPGKADSVPPESQSQSGGGSATAVQRSKVSFVKGQGVVFKPKATAANESPDWVLGRVQQVLGEGKARRYKVQDADPDLPPDQRSEFRTSASNMIPIPPVGTDLPGLEVGKTVLAEYPDSTTFYKAEVMGTEPSTGKISLKFAGEENSDTLQLVERRKVVEFRS